MSAYSAWPTGATWHRRTEGYLTYVLHLDLTCTKMVQMEGRVEVIRELLRDVPVSIRALARASGVSHVALIRAREDKTRLSPDVVERIISALREWSGSLSEWADRLEAVSDEAAGGDPPRSGG